jgi:hypothetical protein
MANDPFYVPGHRLPPARVPRPAEPLWEFRQDHRTYACELRCHGEWGVEAQILKDGDLLVAYRLDTRRLATRWADETRTLIENGVDFD